MLGGVGLIGYCGGEGMGGGDGEREGERWGEGGGRGDQQQVGGDGEREEERGGGGGEGGWNGDGDGLLEKRLPEVGDDGGDR